MFVNFLVDTLHLENSETACNYVPWYDGAGQTLGMVIPGLSALLFVLLFYFLWSRMKATTTAHWLLAGFLGMVVTFFASLFIGRTSLGNWILMDLGDEFEDLQVTVTTWPYTTDLWIYALNCALWFLVFYFVFSLVFKNWSTVYNIPFGRKIMKAKN